MNEFTKEELRTLLFWGIDRLEHIGIQEFKDEGHDDLYLKLQRMIEAYCEHESDIWADFSSPRLGLNYRLSQCKKCGEFYR